MKTKTFLLRKMPVSLTSVSKLLLNTSARDKVVKFLQYVSRILLGFYGPYLTKNLMQALQQVKDVTSLSRRLFRLFKSFDHLHRIVWALPNLMDVDEKPEGGLEDILIESVSMLEQFSLMLYYAYENYLLLVSTRLLRMDPARESKLRNESSIVSFVGNIARCIAACLRISRVQRLTAIKQLRCQKLMARYCNEVNLVNTSIRNSSGGVDTGSNENGINAVSSSSSRSGSGSSIVRGSEEIGVMAEGVRVETNIQDSHSSSGGKSGGGGGGGALSSHGSRNDRAISSSSSSSSSSFLLQTESTATPTIHNAYPASTSVSSYHYRCMVRTLQEKFRLEQVAHGALAS